MTKNILQLNTYLILLAAFLFSCDSETRMQREAKRQAKLAEEAAAKAAKNRKPEPVSLIVPKDSVTQILTAYGKENSENTVVITTEYGKIKIKLYEDTPLHRANFIMLTKKGYLSETAFTRVVPGFMIQGGDSEKRKMKINAYTIPQEMKPKYFHKRGAVAMAMKEENNPGKESSGRYFYIVQGTKYNIPTLELMNKDLESKLTPAKTKVYSTIGGAPHLDGKYTVFGEVLEGMDVVDKIAKQKAYPSEQLEKEVLMDVEIVK